MSPWAGASRAPLRIVIGLSMALDTVLAAVFLGSLHPSALSHPRAPGWLLALGANRPALVLIATIGVAASLLFARRARAWVAGLVALASVGILVEAQGALLQGPMRFLFFSGTCLVGWLFGLAVARDEAVGEQGAVAALAAAYLGAFLSKLAHGGVGWVNHGGLRADIAGQHVWGHSRVLDALAMLVLDHAWLAYALAAFALVAQGSAVLMPFSRRGRMLSGALLLAFHAGVWLLMPIVFPQAMVLVAAFAFPWPRWLGRGGSETFRPASPRTAVVAVAAVAAVVAVAWLPPLRAYTRFPRALVQAQPVSEDMRAVLGSLVEGATIGELRVERIEQVAPGHVRIVLSRGVVIDVARHGTRPFAPPRTVGAFDLYYRGGGGAVADAALDAVAGRLRAP
jgi:hypothetical protein